MVDLQKLRTEIDAIDQEIVALFERRMQISKQVAEFKLETGKKVFDKEREDAKIKAVQDMASSAFNKHGASELFIQVMAMSRKLQYQLMNKQGKTTPLPFAEIRGIDKQSARVVFQGVDGAYSQIAMKSYFGDGIESYHVDTFRDTMEEIKHHRADFAVLPIENSSAGIVNDNYDLLVEYDNIIAGEEILKINQALLGLKGSKIEDIKTVYSHPQGLMQSAKFLEEHRDWQQISTKNTALSALKILKENDMTQAAIASVEAAKYYGLDVLNPCISFSDKNSTRFIIVTNRKIFTEDADKISVCFEVPHESGTLYNMLSHFIYNDLNLTKIESRPIEDKTWEYRFFVDFEGNLKDSAVKNALLGIQEEAINFKILGNYKKYEEK